MIKALRVIMIVYAAIGILFGLTFVFLPSIVAGMFGLEEIPPSTSAIGVVLGASFVSACIFLIIAARDPLKNLLFVRYAIVFAILSFAAELYNGLIAYEDFSQAAEGIVIHGLFAVLFLVFYPWHRKESSIATS